MTNSSGAQDHSFGAIEAAVRETVRGRAFLADYAKRVRQSDTWTLLAMLGRLERWCQEQSVRLAELEECNSRLGRLPPGSQSGVALDRRAASIEQLGSEASLPANHLEVLTMAMGDQYPASRDRTSYDTDGEMVDDKVRGRIERLTTTFSDLDRRTSDLVGQSSVGAQIGETGFTAVSAVDDGVRSLSYHSATTHEWARSSRNTLDKCPLEEDVLDGIAQALGRRSTSDDW
jgi:hypothetical protein